MTREEWLLQLVEKLRPLIDSVDGFTVPDVIRISTSWPSTGGLSKRRRLGECWEPKASRDGSSQIFISPLLDDVYEVARVTLHELAHAATPGAKHKGRFVVLCKALGFEKPWTVTPARVELEETLRGIVTSLPEYPHVPLDPNELRKKKQKARMLKLECPDCGFTARAARKWIDSQLPLCVNGHAEKEFVLIETGEEEEK